MSEMYLPEEQNTQIDTSTEISLSDSANEDMNEPFSININIRPIEDINNSLQDDLIKQKIEIPNGDDVLNLALPETMTLMNMLVLVGKNLGLNYVYDPATIGKQTISLKMHGTTEGQMKVRDLYSLLETVLKYHNLAMIRRDNNFVNIVPINQVMEVDPELINMTNNILQAGDTVVTCIFELHYVDVESVTSLLQNMKLAVSVMPIKDSQVLFVTCFAHRLERIEEIIKMLDEPGILKECRIRRLKYAFAAKLSDRVCKLAKELRNINIVTSSSASPEK